MILYSSSASDFMKSVDDNTIVDRVSEAFLVNLGRNPGTGERRSWNNSMRFMESIIRKAKVADDCGVLIEFNIPASSKRVDFIISGTNERNESNFVVVELKQWETAKATDKEDIVQAFVGGAERELTHPSYQAWSYKQMIDDMNTAVHSNSIRSYACAYLHNFSKRIPEPLVSEQYEQVVSHTPVYFKNDTEKLQDFLSRHVGRGKGMDILYEIEHGEIKPSKKLMDFVASMFEGNQEFVLIDEQKVAFEAIMSTAKKRDKKRTIIVVGGPGTGKSVVSINAFGKLIQERLNVQFVAPNASFREVMIEKLASGTTRSRTRLKNLFSGSAQFYNSEPDIFDVLVVDEAHRLKDSRQYMYRGDNQVEDIIRSSRVNVFFIDDSQRVRPSDVGSVDEIKRIAAQYNSEVYEVKLEAQFRCSGAEGFINWLDTVLQIQDTANYDGWDKSAFDFQIVDDPNILRDLILEKNDEGFDARLLAGYAWKWTSEKDGNPDAQFDDVVIEEFDFKMPWNSRKSSTMWAVLPEGMSQVGCIHTSQGLEFDYVGVIVGPDLKFDDEKKQLIASYNDYKDSVGKAGLRDDPVKLTELVTNVYKTLMSRGMKGCYIYCVDEKLQKHFMERLAHTNNIYIRDVGPDKKTIPVEVSYNIRDELKSERDS